MSQQDDGDETEEQVEEDSFGYSLEGRWEDIVRFGEEIISTFEEHDVKQETISEWDAWRPRSGEQEEEMREKTVEKAKVEEGDQTAESAAETAEKLSETREKTAEGEIGEAAEKASEASKSAGKTVGDASRDVVRAVEDKVYRRITKTNPLYFDTENFNASLKVVESIGEKVGKVKDKLVNGETDEGHDDRRYKMTIKAESDEVKEALDEEFEDEETDG
ncbi:MAG: DUF5828 family protein [Halobacteria archaeon]